MTSEGDSVIFYGNVGKVGADGSSLPRSVFITSAALLVCLTTGGVTRTISLANVMEVLLEKRDADGMPLRCTVRVRGETLLVLDFANKDDVDGFIDAVRRAASHVRILHGNAETPREKHFVFEGSRSAPKEVRFADPHELPKSPLPIASLTSSSTTGGIHHRLSSPSSSVRLTNRASGHAVTIPVEPLELVEDKKKNGAYPETHMSPFRREMPIPSIGSSAANAISPRRNGDHNVEVALPLYETDPTSPAPFIRESTRYRHTNRDAATSIGPILSTDLELREQEVNHLRSELQEKNAFIDDLKTALRSQEHVFHEMVKATEQLRVVEGSRSQLEKQVGLLQAEVKRLEEVMKKNEANHKSELALKLTELHEAHSNEVTALQEAFAQYDAQMTEYLENLEADRGRETRKWGERERLSQKQIESQKQEIAELVNTLASYGVRSSNTAASELGHVGGNRVFSASHLKPDVTGRSRQALPADLSTPALELRLASLEEEHTRTRLVEKPHGHTRSRRCTSPRVLFDSDRGDRHPESEEKAAGICMTSREAPRPESRHVPTSRVRASGDDVTSLLVSTPGTFRGTRNRAIL